MNIDELAKATVTYLAPFLPYLVSFGKSVAKKIEDVMADQGGETAWKLAQQLWGKIIGWFKDDVEVSSAANMVATDPQNTLRQQLLEQVLTQRLQAEPAFAEELLSLLGGSTRLQEILGGNRAKISANTQEMTGLGTQRMGAQDDAVITDNRQIQR